MKTKHLGSRGSMVAKLKLKGPGEVSTFLVPSTAGCQFLSYRKNLFVNL